MTFETRHGARRTGGAPLRSALSVVVVAAFAVTMTAPSQFAFAGVGGAGVLDHPSTAGQLLIQVGKGGEIKAIRPGGATAAVEATSIERSCADLAATRPSLREARRTPSLSALTSTRPT